MPESTDRKTDDEASIEPDCQSASNIGSDSHLMKFWRGLALVSSGNQRDDLSSSPFDVRAEWLPCRERRL